MSVMKIVDAAPQENPLADTAVQTVMNNTPDYYGELSRYGRDIPLACVGIISKVNSLSNAIVLGIARSIIGYNYGTGDTARIKEAFRRVAKVILRISISAFCASSSAPG